MQDLMMELGEPLLEFNTNKQSEEKKEEESVPKKP
jgi:hypothetical protein